MRSNPKYTAKRKSSKAKKACNAIDRSPFQQCAETTRLCLLTLALSDLGRETGLDGGDGTARSTGVTGDEGQAVLSLVELGIWRSAGFASDVLHCELLALIFLFSSFKG